MITLKKSYKHYGRGNNAIMKIFLNSEYDVKVKKDDSPVTKADLLAHKIIVKG